MVPYTITSLRNFHGLLLWQRPCTVLTSCGDLYHHSGHRQHDWNCCVYAISDNTKLILGLCNMNKWWRWHRLHTLARFGRNFVCHVTYLPISTQERPRVELSYRGYSQQPVEFKIVRTEKWLRTKLPSRTCPLRSLHIGTAVVCFGTLFIGILNYSARDIFKRISALSVMEAYNLIPTTVPASLFVTALGSLVLYITQLLVNKREDVPS